MMLASLILFIGFNPQVKTPPAPPVPEVQLFASETTSIEYFIQQRNQVGFQEYLLSLAWEQIKAKVEKNHPGYTIEITANGPTLTPIKKAPAPTPNPSTKDTK